MNAKERRGFCLFLVLLASICLLVTVRNNPMAKENMAVRVEAMPKTPMLVNIVYLPPQPKPKTKPMTKTKTEKQSKPTSLAPPQSQKAGAGQGSKGNGVNIVGAFDCDFDFYLEIMQAKGSLLVVYEDRKKLFFQVIGDAVLPLERLQGDFSPIARNVTRDHPQAGTLLQAASRQGGRGSYSLLLFWPKSIQGQVDAAISRQLTDTHKHGGTVFIRYRRSGDNLLFDFEKANLDGKTIAMDYRMTLN